MDRKLYYFEGVIQLFFSSLIIKCNNNQNRLVTDTQISATLDDFIVPKLAIQHEYTSEVPWHSVTVSSFITDTQVKCYNTLRRLAYHSYITLGMTSVIL
jgi:hypothetical protein